MNYFRARKRRGLSSIVGTLFFIAIMVAAFTAILAAFSYQNDLIDTQRTIADLEIAKSQENFIIKGEMELASVNCIPTLPNDACLKVTVYNKGTNPVEVDQLWLIQKADPYDATPYNQGSLPPLMFQDLVVPISTSKDITSNSIEVDSVRLYSIKVVSKLGTIVTADVPDPCPQCLQGDEGQQCWDIFPFPDGNGQKDLAEEDLNGDGFVDVLDCQGAEGAPGSGVTPTIEDDLFNKPGIFMTFPSPYGQSDKVGTWGAVIGNPTPKDMDIDKIVFTVIPFSTQSGQTIFSSCASQPNWTCLGNQVIWKSATPVTIPATSAAQFFLDVVPNQGAVADVHGLPVFASVLTSDGQFGKTNYLSSVVAPTSNNKSPIVNVYYSLTPDILTATGVINMDSGEERDIFITMAEKSTGGGLYDDAYIDSAGGNTHLIVNVPKLFLVGDGANGMAAPDGFGAYSIPPVVPNSDTSVQIKGTLLENIGDNNPAGTDDARSFKIRIKAPDLSGLIPPLQERLFVMYILADGTARCVCTSNPWPIGPLAEVVIRVHDASWP